MIDVFVKIKTSHKAVVFFFRFTRKRFFKLPCVSLYVKHISCAYLVTQLDPKKNPSVITTKSLANEGGTSRLG